MILYISDLDGTLLNSEQEISRESAEVLNSLINEGLNFTVATARALDSVKYMLSPLELRLPMILSNGAFIYDPIKNEYIVSKMIDCSIYGDIIKICNELGESPLVFTMGSNGESKVFYSSLENKSIRQFVEGWQSKGDKRFRQTQDLYHCTGDGIFTVALATQGDRVEELSEILAARLDLLVHYHEDIYLEGYYWIEIANKTATKKNAVEFLKEHLKADKLVCFGDNLNDSSMFETADSCYAVGNAHEILKKYCTGVIGCNNEDGVARFLKENWGRNGGAG